MQSEPPKKEYANFIKNELNGLLLQVEQDNGIEINELDLSATKEGAKEESKENNNEKFEETNRFFRKTM